MTSPKNAQSSLVYPPPLKAGGTIGIVSPARWSKPDWLVKGKAFLEARGYQVVIHAQNYLKDGQLAGHDAARAEAIMDMFADATIDAIFCARGGTGSMRLLDKLDYRFIKQNPKPFVGFSDITALLQAISAQCGFVTFHGPMFWNFAHDYDERMSEDLFQIIGTKNARVNLKFPEAETVRAGTAKARITGGNLALLQSLVGTPYDWSGKDVILFIEDVDEVLYRLDRELNHLRLAGKFEGVRAVIVGEMVDIGDGETGFMRAGEQPYGSDLKQIFVRHLPPEVPICFNFPCGHGRYLTTLPIGSCGELTLSDNGAELTIIR